MNREMHTSLRQYHLFADSLIKLMHRWCTQSIMCGDAATVVQLNLLISTLYAANTHIAWQREIVRAHLDAEVPPESNRPDAVTSMLLNLVATVRHLTNTERAVDAVREYINTLTNTQYITSPLWVKCCRMILGTKITAEIADMRAAIQRAT